MANLTGTQKATLSLIMAAFTTATPGHADSFNPLWQQLLDNDATVGALLTALTTRVNELGSSANLTIGSVPGLQAALDGKASLIHSHAVGIGDVTGLQAQLSELQARLYTLETSGGGSGGSDGSGSGGTVNFPLQINIVQTDRLSDTPYTTTGTANGTSSAGAVTGYAWSWSGGNANGANPQIVFGGPGTYLVSCTATDAAGNTATASTTLVVAQEAPVQSMDLALTSSTTTTQRAGGVTTTDTTPGGTTVRQYFFRTSNASGGSYTASDQTTGLFQLSGLPAGARILGASVVGTLAVTVNGDTASPVYTNGSPRVRIEALSGGVSVGSASRAPGTSSNTVQTTSFGSVEVPLAPTPTLNQAVEVRLSVSDMSASGTSSSFTDAYDSVVLRVSYKA